MAVLKKIHFTIFLALFITIFPQSEETTINSRKLDQTPSDEGDNKCGGCPCNNPCNQPASPPPPSPSPPPPSLPPPPPTPKNPSPSSNCPPPPSGGGGGQYPPFSPYPPNPPYIFINGPPADLYPVDNYSSDSGRSFSTGGAVQRLLIGGFMGLVAFW